MKYFVYIVLIKLRYEANEIIIIYISQRNKIFVILFIFVDMIAIPDFAAGAMENWGLITYRARALLYKEDASSISNKFYVASVVSHELAHQV